MSEQAKKVTGAVQMVAAVAEAIRELGEVPAGHLYAHVAGVLSLEQFEQAISILVRAELVRREPSHLLVWTGPMRGERAEAVSP